MDRRLLIIFGLFVQLFAAPALASRAHGSCATLACETTCCTDCCAPNAPVEDEPCACVACPECTLRLDGEPLTVQFASRALDLPSGDACVALLTWIDEKPRTTRVPSWLDDAAPPERERCAPPSTGRWLL